MVLHCREGTHRHRITDLFQNAGVEPHRIQFVPRISGREYFKLYSQIDIGLDPFPYPGGTTTVAMLALDGRAGGDAEGTDSGSLLRGEGVSILSNVGLEGLVAESIDQYVELAAGLAAGLSDLPNSAGRCAHADAEFATDGCAGIYPGVRRRAQGNVEGVVRDLMLMHACGCLLIDRTGYDPARWQR